MMVVSAFSYGQYTLTVQENRDPLQFLIHSISWFEQGSLMHSNSLSILPVLFHTLVGYKYYWLLIS